MATAGDGHSARSLLSGDLQFDLVVSDLKMPGLDGIELLREFDHQQPQASLVLMSSADAQTLRAAEQVAEARRLRILGAVPKPVTSLALQQLLMKRNAGKPGRSGSRPVAPLVTAEQLSAAIAAEEIDVYVQPKIGFRDERVVGVEALARWHRPDGSMVMPGAFIGLAERSCLSDPLTRLVLRQALRGWAAWRQEGLDLSISINVPIDSLDQLDFPDAVDLEAAEYGVPVDRIVLEITETGLMRDLARSLDVVTRLRLRGFRLSIDDFGIGYSSLEQLRRFPFSELKLDRAFVDGASLDNSLRSIVESSIRLAKDLNLRTCAEGIETQADFELMRQLGCDQAQGFLIARPMPKQDFPSWARTRETDLGGLAE